MDLEKKVSQFKKGGSPFTHHPQDISLWVLQWSQEGKKTMLMQFFGEGGGANKVYYGRCAKGEWDDP